MSTTEGTAAVIIKAELPKFRFYGPGADSFNGRAVEFTIGPLSIYYSYDTIVAFNYNGKSLTVSKNQWSVTTGKHLNAIDGGNKKQRLPRNEFEARLQAVLAELGLRDLPAENPPRDRDGYGER